MLARATVVPTPRGTARRGGARGRGGGAGRRNTRDEGRLLSMWKGHGPKIDVCMLTHCGGGNRIRNEQNGGVSRHVPGRKKSGPCTLIHPRPQGGARRHGPGSRRTRRWSWS